MCCSKYPPAGLTCSLYVLAFGVLLYQILSTSGLYVVGPVKMRLLSVKPCPGVETQAELALSLSDYNETGQMITGNFSFPFMIDDYFKITLRGAKLEHGKWAAERDYVNNRTLCRVIDNYVWEMTAKSGHKLHSGSMCPILGGRYRVEEFLPDLERRLPAELVGHVKFLLEVRTAEEIYVCQEAEFENTLLGMPI